ncbi:NADH-quinone oxidoreductase subunit N [Mycobacterium sp. IDR2000157661]|uniref:NADH-quinone oxidoreductase subunit N n=1 Tax=Mycobacterium sp. IDR2000157661 TaxID=2867005 RepID=UPI001EEDA135|nr:proton-conducting transporter membrane subunit [Mycobacterium sp. IDR2000157661]ULE35795.1 NADH-quinone oxidoreductase subunit N [Mycobacterium sp. IDR2000157661]
MNLSLMLPEMLVFGAGLTVLIGGSFLPRSRQWWGRVVAAAALCGSAVVAAIQLAGPDAEAFDGTFAVDTATAVARIAAAVGLLAVLAVAGDELAGAARESEIYALLLFATTGVLVLAGAADLIVLVTGYLLASIPLYALIGLARTAEGAEAAMKTYLLGALFGILLLSGVTVLYGLTGSTWYATLAGELAPAPAGAVAVGLLGLLGGLMFKAGGVPAHFWVPDAAQGASGAVATFVTTVPKLGALIALYRLAELLPATIAWPLLIAVLAVASMTLGNLAAYWQSDPRRLLGWSTVSQVGYLLVPIAVLNRSDLAVPALLFYLIAYTVTNVAAFAVSTSLPQLRDIGSYRGLAYARPWLAGALVVALLGLLGTPPTAVFVGKLTTAGAAWDGGAAWLAVIVFVNTLISLFYYLRWIIPCYQRADHDRRAAFAAGRWSAAIAVAAAGLSLVLGVGAGLVWALVGG